MVTIHYHEYEITLLANKSAPFYNSCSVWKSGGIYDPNEIRRARKKRRKGKKQ